ncbi:hypothetical protein PMIN06_008538 [Paraphaeosphaeria minitans]|uniref:Metalloendopeptidase n=1 Tax=Paraphaeosphaeria minitans TaxID=565426 RepID=A0A9P6GAQ3_9PLEO|nr:hypothetical protein PMIN01_10748 [Paraphaeosphaeria minitans]
MAILTRIGALLLLCLPVVITYSWTPISPDQSFPLPDVRSPELLPDLDNGAQATPGNASVALQSRWLSDFFSGGSQPWPVRGILKKSHRIRYCFATAEMKQKMECRLNEAIALWSEALGGGPGKDSGHNMEFSEVHFAGVHQLCFKQFIYKDWTGTRNPLVSKDVLAVFVKDEASAGGVSSATLGYTPQERASPDDLKRFRHRLTISDNNQAFTIAHEIGHVLGLQHEMARPDRDDFVEFRCTKLRGFAGAILSAQSNPENKDLTIQEISNKLCNDIYFALDNKFVAYNYIMTPDQGDQGESFDVDSIMMYGSTAFAAHYCGKTALDECPLVKIEKLNGVKVGIAEVEIPSHPSKGDVAFVRKYYPWKG